MAPVAPSCGFATDCFPKYTLAHVNVSAARWGVCDMRARRQAAEYKSLHEQAVATCTAVAGRFMPTGAYCLPETLRNATFGKPRRRRISLPNGQSYAIPFDPTYETPTQLRARLACGRKALADAHFATLHHWHTPEHY